MRNFHRDFESLNEAYISQVQPKCECTINESVTDDIAMKHRDGSIKALKEALRALAKAHHEDYSNVTMEDVYSEMKLFAEENLPTQTGIHVPTGPESPIHNPSPMGIATEDSHEDEDEDEDEVEEGTDGSTDDLTEFEKKRLKKHTGKEKVEETTHSPENSCMDDEYYCHEDKECKKKVGENFEKMLDLMKLTDQHHPMNGQVVEEEMYDCMRDGLSYAECCAQYPRECREDRRSGRSSVKSESDESDEDEDVEEVEEADGAAQLGGVAGQKDAAYKKGLDAAFDIQAKVSSERNPIKRAMMSKDAKKVTRGVNKYMTALTGKLVDMTQDLK